MQAARPPGVLEVFVDVGKNGGGADLGLDHLDQLGLGRVTSHFPMFRPMIFPGGNRAALELHGRFDRGKFLAEFEEDRGAGHKV